MLCILLKHICQIIVICVDGILASLQSRHTVYSSQKYQNISCNVLFLCLIVISIGMNNTAIQFAVTLLQSTFTSFVALYPH